MNLTSDEFEKISTIRKLVLDWAVGDIHKAAHMRSDYSGYMDRDILEAAFPWYDGGAMIGAVILGMCAIQLVACFNKSVKDGQAFINFVDKYIPQYNGDELYSLRNALIKQYSTRCYVIGKKGEEIIYIISNNNSRLHLTRQNNVIVINVEDFAKDINRAIVQFFNDCLNGNQSDEIINKIIEHYDKHLPKK